MVAERGHALQPSAEKAVGSRQPAWRSTTRVEQKEKSKSNEQQTAYAKEYAVKLEAEFQKVCDGILTLMDESLIPSASTGQPKAFYYEMKDNYHRFLAEFAASDPKSKISQDAADGRRR